MKKIKFIKSPVGAFLLAYFENDIAEVEAKLAAELIESGFGIEVIDENQELTETISEEVKPKKKK